MLRVSNVRLEIDPADKVLLRRHLNKNGKAQVFFTSEVRRLSDPYVPMRNGVLKTTAVEMPDKIIYPQPYARRQYYEHKGSGLRGPQWEKRMWASRGKEIVRAVAKFAGGKAK